MDVMSDLIERLRDFAGDSMGMEQGDRQVLAEAADEIERLGKENFEQQIVLEAHRQTNERLTDKLERIERWCKAYPRTVFIEPTKEQWAAADKALNRSDCPSLTAISGSNMRHVVEGIKAIYWRER
jgi:hypothetical protein